MSLKPNVLSIFASPRKQGFSSLIHEKFLEPFKGNTELNKIFVYDENISPCNACGICADEEKCSINDSMQKIYGLIKSADLISVSSPLYFSSLPGQLKNLIDRCEFFWKNRIDYKTRSGFFISAAGNNGYKNMFLPSVTVIRHFFKTVECAYSEDDFILFAGTDSMEKVTNELMETAYKTGEKYLRKIRNN
jgi:multimeric flavodoxin WrbA